MKVNLVDYFINLAQIDLDEEIRKMRAVRIPSKRKRELRRKYAKKHTKRI